MLMDLDGYGWLSPVAVITDEEEVLDEHHCLAAARTRGIEVPLLDVIVCVRRCKSFHSACSTLEYCLLHPRCDLH